MASCFGPRAKALALFVSALLLPTPAFAHCDGLDGPVVAAARQALDAGDPNAALVWVQPGDEAAIRAAFDETLAVRRLGPQALELADRYFFETLVRLHRAGEGAPYTGLEPAGRDLGPAIPMADQAIETGSQAALLDYVSREVTRGLNSRFEELQRKRQVRHRDLAAGREYVASYVSYIHYVEGIHEAIAASAEGHYPEEPAPQRSHE